MSVAGVGLDATVIVPIKPWRLAKSRLDVGRSGRRDLARAFALDVLDAVASSDQVARLVIVTAEERVTAKARELGAVVLPDRPLLSGNMLNVAVDRGRQWAISHAPASPVVVVPSDLPAVTTPVFDAALEVLGQAESAFVPDVSGRGTTAVWSRTARRLRTFYGPDSALRHAEDGSRPTVEVDPRMRQDVDTMTDLRAVELLGLGRHSAAVLQSVSRRRVHRHMIHG